MNQNVGCDVGTASGGKNTNRINAIQPYMPICQALGESVPPLIAALSALPKDTSRIGLMVKY